MINRNETYSRLASASTKYRQLATTFDEFSTLAIGDVTAENFQIKGITAKADPATGRTSVTFAGKTICFAFVFSYPRGSAAVGKVVCYLERTYPEPSVEKLGEFTFNHTGESSEKFTDNDELYISGQTGATYIVLHYLEVALAKP